jgi:hypothetical protein
MPNAVRARVSLRQDSQVGPWGRIRKEVDWAAHEGSTGGNDTHDGRHRTAPSSSTLPSIQPT